MRYLIIDKKSKSYSSLSTWLTRLAIKFLINKGVIHSKEYTEKTFEYLFTSGGYSAVCDVDNVDKAWLNFKNRDLI